MEWPKLCDLASSRLSSNLSIGLGCTRGVHDLVASSTILIVRLFPSKSQFHRRDFHPSWKNASSVIWIATNEMPGMTGLWFRVGVWFTKAGP